MIFVQMPLPLNTNSGRMFISGDENTMVKQVMRSLNNICFFFYENVLTFKVKGALFIRLILVQGHLVAIEDWGINIVFL